MESAPDNFLHYEPQRRRTRANVWQQIGFYALGLVGLAVVLLAIFIGVVTFAERHGFW